MGLGSAALLTVTFAPTATAAPSTDLVISQVYGGGGNSGAPLRNDYIELHDVGGASADLGGWSVQYLPAQPSAHGAWQVTPLSGTLSSGAHYLVAEAAGSHNATALPTPDATGTIPMSSSAGTVALVHSRTPLSCLSAADCAAQATIHDLLGYSEATVREGSPAPALSNTTAERRTGADTDDNAADFHAVAPRPRNSAGQTTPPGSPPPGGPTEPGDVRIPQIHGTTFRSPYNGKQVSGVPGVVTAIATAGRSRGFYFAEPGAHDPRSSSALYVYTSSNAPAVAVGDEVLVSGTVSDYYVDAPESKSLDLPITELSNPRYTVLSSGNPLPKPVVLGPNTVPDALSAHPRGRDILGDTLQPARYALDFYKAHESELVEVDNARVVGPSNAYGEMWVTSKPKQHPSARGGTLYSGYDTPNTGRLLLSALPGWPALPQSNVSDVLAGRTSGPLSYSNYGGYEMLVEHAGSRVDNHLKPEVTSAQRTDQLAVATYNVENLSPKDPASKFTALAKGVVHNLAKPDIVSLEEIQDNDGPTDDGVVAADATLREFTGAIVA
ncbi:MAG: lamin tail domain-containing protein, partial [Sciscionella sp.]